MKKRYSIILVLSLMLFMNGCTNQADSLKYIHENAGGSHIKLASYEVNIGNKVGGGTLVAELWQNGECTEGSPVTLNNQTKEIGISLLIDGSGTDESAKGLNAQIDVDEALGSELTYFELPQGIIGYSFTAYEDNEVIEISEDEEVILAALAFDTGAGVSGVDCKKLASEPDVLSSYSCIIVVRAEFTSEQIEA